MDPSVEAQTLALESFGYRQELKRSLSLFDLVVYGLVFIVPIAPMAVFGFVFNASRGMVPLIYVLGLVAMVFTALSYMAMAKAFPVAGSVFTYATKSLGPTIGFFAGWGILLDYLLMPTVNYVACAIAMHAALPEIPKAFWVVSLLGIATIVNYYGIETTARANTLMLIVSLFILLIFFLVGGIAVVHHTAGAHLSFAPFYNPKDFSPSLLFGALSLAVLSFLGFDAISTLSEESRGGAHAVAHATMLSLCIAATLFVVQTWLACLFVLGRSHFAPGTASEEAIYGVARTIGGFPLEFLLTVPGVLFSGIASALTAQAATARLLFSMARDGRLPRTLAHVHGLRKVPERAIFVVGAITLVLSLALLDQLELLTSMVSFGALLGFLLLHLSVMVHFIGRRQSRDWLNHLVVPAIGLAIIGYVLWNAETNAKIAGAGWLVLGAGVLLLAARKGRSVHLPVA